MKTKFLAGLVASLICFVLIVAAAILMVVVFDMDENGNLPRIIAFAAIALWLGLYNWLKPKQVIEPKVENQNQESQQENKTERNSYN